MKHIVSRMSSYFPNRWPFSYLNLTKNMKTYIRRQQHKNIFKHQDIKRKERKDNKRLEYKTKLLDDKVAEVSARLDQESNDNLEQHQEHYASIQQNKDEIDKLRTDLPETTSLNTANIHNLQNQI